MNVRILSCIGAIAVTIACAQTVLVPYYDGNTLRPTNAFDFKAKIGAANLADVQSINARVTALESTITNLTSRIASLEKAAGGNNTGSVPIVPCQAQDARWMWKLPSGQCIAGELTPFNAPVASIKRFEPVALADLPQACGEGDFAYVWDASTKTGGTPFYFGRIENPGDPCTWGQLAFQASGLGTHAVLCNQKGFCGIELNTGVFDLAKVQQLLSPQF